MKLLITGATGGIGTRIIEIAKTNYKINFLTTNKSKLKSIKSAKGFFWDPKNNFIDSLNIVGASYCGASVSWNH